MTILKQSVLILLLTLGLSACGVRGNPEAPVPTQVQ